MFSSIEICAGAGGQALGIEQGGFDHKVLVEIDSSACATLRLNRPHWNVIEGDVKEFSALEYKGIDLLAGGVPCPPFSVAGKQLGHEDERDLFPEMIRLTKECNPKAVMIENVKGIFSSKFDTYRDKIVKQLEDLGYVCTWKVVNAMHYGVPQQRWRSILIALKNEYSSHFVWPEGDKEQKNLSVGNALFGEMSKDGWEGASDWAAKATGVAPTIVGGSKKHGGADLGPTRSKEAWKILGVDGGGIADNPPTKGFQGMPKLTLRMAGLIQGFPPDWKFFGKKTPAYRQVGNAFPPAVAKAFAEAIFNALMSNSFNKEVSNG